MAFEFDYRVAARQTENLFAGPRQRGRQYAKRFVAVLDVECHVFFETFDSYRR